MILMENLVGIMPVIRIKNPLQNVYKSFFSVISEQLDGRDSPDQIVPSKSFFSRLTAVSSTRSLSKGLPSLSGSSVMVADCPTPDGTSAAQSTVNKETEKPGSIFESIVVRHHA